MTVFGKILTFVILVLALVQAGLHIMFHIARTNYEAAYAKALERQQAMNSELIAYDKERKDATDERERLKMDIARSAGMNDNDAVGKSLSEIVALAKGKIDETTRQAKDKDDQITKLSEDNKRLNAALSGGLRDLATNSADVQRRDLEVNQLDKSLKAAHQQIRDMITTVNESRDRAVRAEIEAKDLKFRNEQMVEQLAEKEKLINQLNVRLTSPGGGLAGPGGPTNVSLSPSPAGGSAMGRNPPSDNVEGLITRTDPQSGMVTISIGSDAGVVKGNTLEVFRLNPPKYLGTIRILEARPNEAVGKPVSKPLGPIMQGDRVASKILGT